MNSSGLYKTESSNSATTMTTASMPTSTTIGSTTTSLTAELVTQDSPSTNSAISTITGTTTTPVHGHHTSISKLRNFYHYWNDYYSGSWSSYFYIAWDGSYYYDDGYWYGDYYDDYYYYAPTRRDTEAISDSLNTKELPRVIRHGSKYSK